MHHMTRQSGCHLSPVSCLLCAVCCLFASGCRTATRITEVPRVDLELSSGGNRGYLVGAPPEEARLKTTRQIVRTDMEIPSFYTAQPSTPRGGAATVSVGEIESQETEQHECAASVPSAASYDTYVVQKGESLWAVAARPEIYGRGSQWHRLLTANADQLKGNPNFVRAGMTLKIPRGEPEASETQADVVRRRGDDEGTTFKK